MEHHEESKKAGNTVRTAIINPERQTGQVAGGVGPGGTGSGRLGVTWRS